MTVKYSTRRSHEDECVHPTCSLTVTREKKFCNTHYHRFKRSGRLVKPHDFDSEQLRWCPQCKLYRSLQSFQYVGKDDAVRLRSYCADCHRKWGWQNYLQRTYDITVDQYDEAYVAQGGKCATCRRDMKLHIDHSHETGQFRGLLCDSCNKALGMVRDEPATLRAMADYLERF